MPPLHLLTVFLVVVAEVLSASLAAEDTWVAVKRVHLPVSKFKILYNRLANDARQQGMGSVYFTYGTQPTFGQSRECTTKFAINIIDEIWRYFISLLV